MTAYSLTADLSAVRRVVDCSHSISPAMPHWPGDPVTSFTPCATMKQDGYRLRSFTMSEHGATHCNAPSSFFAAGADISAVLAAPVVLPVAVADMAGAAAGDADICFTPQDLAAWERTYGTVAAGTLFWLHTGWATRWSHGARPWRFFGWDEPPQPGTQQPAMHFPAFAPETAEILICERGVRGLGIDTHGVDSPRDTEFSVNRRVLENGGLVLECLAKLEALPPVGGIAVIGGLKLAGGTGTPVSVTVLIP